MSVKELYYQFQLLLNKNNEKQNINIDRGNFVILYNREAVRCLNAYVDKNNSTDDIFNVFEFVVSDKELQKNRTTDNYIEYEVPDDMFNLIAGKSYSVVTQGKCKGIVRNNFKKIGNSNINLEDSFTKPSFDWERGIGELDGTSIKIYKEDFNIEKSYISYYKTPDYIDIEGYKRIDGNDSTNIDPAYSDWFCGVVLDAVVKEVQREYQDQLGFQLSQDRKAEQL